MNFAYNNRCKDVMDAGGSPNHDDEELALTIQRLQLEEDTQDLLQNRLKKFWERGDISNLPEEFMQSIDNLCENGSIATISTFSDVFLQLASASIAGLLNKATEEQLACKLLNASGLNRVECMCRKSSTPPEWMEMFFRLLHRFASNSEQAVFARLGAGSAAISRGKAEDVKRGKEDFDEVYETIMTHGKTLSCEAVLTVGRVAHFYNGRAKTPGGARELSDYAIERLNELHELECPHLKTFAGECFLENAASRLTLDDADVEGPLEKANNLLAHLYSRDPRKRRLSHLRQRLRQLKKKDKSFSSYHRLLMPLLHGKWD